MYEDRWVQGLQEGKIGTPLMANDNAMLVHELLTTEGKWNEQLLKEKFMEREIAAVLNTPIGERGDEDERTWIYEPTEKFSVMSAYLLQIGSFSHDETTSTTDKKWWGTHVWDTNIPPKARVFLWRAYKELIPKSGNLKERHVPTDGICTLCKDRWATTTHALMFCPKVKEIWKHSSY